MSRNLTGLWVGEYRYPEHALGPDGSPPLPVSFTAQISDQGGSFFGKISEEDGPASIIRGTREGSAVTFSKRYVDTGGGRFLDRVLYQGGLDEEGTRVDGTWSITRIEHEPGDFFMMREKPKADEKEVEQEIEIVEP